jgi:DNA primase catalytic subunit
MTDKERIYKYLNKGIRHRTFRKWLLKHADLTTLFGKDDAQELKELIPLYSHVSKIRNILLKHIDLNELEKYSRYNFILQIINSEKDILETISELSTFSTRTKDDELLNYIIRLKSKYGNIPREIEKNNWNIEIYNQKRKQLDELIPIISKKLIELKHKHYYNFDNLTLKYESMKPKSIFEKLKRILNCH